MKTCFKCLQNKPLSEFYKHPAMKDGHLGKCILCAKSDANFYRLRNLENPEWVEMELARQRAKTSLARKSGKNPSVDAQRDASKKWKIRHPHKRKAQEAVGNAIREGRLRRCPCEVCGDTKSDAHHDNYDNPLEVRWLCRKHHMDHHVEMRRLERETRNSLNSSTNK